MTTTPPPAVASTDLKRELGLFDAVMINARTLIASPIFIVPATVAAALQGTPVMTRVWALGGRLSGLGGLCGRARGGARAFGGEVVGCAGGIGFAFLAAVAVRASGGGRLDRRIWRGDGGRVVGVRRLDRDDLCRQRDRESRPQPAAVDHSLHRHGDG